MSLFKRNTRWVETFRLKDSPGAIRSFLILLFFLWGIGGLVLLGAGIGGLAGNVGVGTSAYMSAICLFWIGGMVLFGMGALLAGSDFSAMKQAEDENSQ